ncbi:MAG: uroporphyrinogen decarboxylase family protein [Lentisphaeria bacterium]|nr:uroporphyrinogen decarboxylase family protein [Lentisphaeria bacterium]
MARKTLYERVQAADAVGRRLVAPLLGFPGVRLVGSTVKLAQQNHGEHFKAIKEICETFSPDLTFPLMDLSVEANALGRYTLFPKEESAVVPADSYSVEELVAQARINIAFDSRLSGYVETMKLMSLGLPANILRGAYVTGPYSLAALMMGADEAAMATVLNTEELTQICEFATERIQEYIRLLIVAGAQVICILEPSAVMLGPDQFEQFSAAYVRYINDSCKYTSVATIYHTCGNTMHLIDKMVQSGVDAISLDAAAAGVDLPTVASALPADVIVMGNINPIGTLLHGSPDAVEAETTELLDSMAEHPNFVLSTGCDIPQETPVGNILAFMRAGRRFHAKA